MTKSKVLIQIFLIIWAVGSLLSCSTNLHRFSGFNNESDNIVSTADFPGHEYDVTADGESLNTMQVTFTNDVFYLYFTKNTGINNYSITQTSNFEVNYQLLDANKKFISKIWGGDIVFDSGQKDGVYCLRVAVKAKVEQLGQNLTLRIEAGSSSDSDYTGTEKWLYDSMWESNTITHQYQSQWYRFTVVAGHRYSIQVADNYSDPNGHFSTDLISNSTIYLYANDKTTQIYWNWDSTEFNRYEYVADFTGTMYVEYTTSSSGSYHIKYTGTYDAETLYGYGSTGQNLLVYGESNYYKFYCTEGNLNTFNFSLSNSNITFYRGDMTTEIHWTLTSGSFEYASMTDETVYIKIISNSFDENYNSISVSSVSNLFTIDYGYWNTFDFNGTQGEVHWIPLEVTAGNTYTISFDNGVEGTGSYDSQCAVSIYGSDKLSEIQYIGYSSYNTPYQYTADTTETLFLKVYNYSGYNYRVKVDESTPSLPDTLMSVGNSYSGYLNNSSVEHWYYFEGIKDTVYNISFDGSAYYSIYNSDKTTPALFDNGSIWLNENPHLAYPSKAIQSYYIKVTGGTGNYTITYIGDELATEYTNFGSWVYKSFSNNFELDWYYFDLYAGFRYEFYMDNGYEGSGSYDADSYLRVIDFDTNNVLKYGISCYTKPLVYYPVTDIGYVDMYVSGSTGTYGLKVVATPDAPMTLGLWSSGMLDYVDDEIWYYYDVTTTGTYKIYLDNDLEGSGSYTSESMFLVFQSDKINHDVSNWSQAYSEPQYRNYIAGERIYIRVKALTTGTFALKISM